jgi:hypothetical protein
LGFAVAVHVLLFDAGSDQEGIHSLELNGHTVVLLFEARDDAERYAGLLEAQDFPVPTVEALDLEEMQLFCLEAGYQAQLVPSGFLPQSQEERLLIAPPERNMDVSNWQEQQLAASGGAGTGRESSGPAANLPERPAEQISSGDPELEAFRRQLEGLL